MKKLFVHYEGWGEHWRLGTLADNGHDLLFEYSPEALHQGLELSPRHLKLRADAYAGFPAYLHRLPGLVADALPDGWGMLIMDRLFRKIGRNPAALSPLDRLAFIGKRAMGALSFEPAEPLELPTEDVDLLSLAQGAQSLMSGHDTDVLRSLVLMGGSPQGARPKVLVDYVPSTGVMSTAPLALSHPWIVKFPARGEHKEVCALEDLYAAIARRCGLDVPETRVFDLDRKLAGFGIARFDVEAGLKVPIHSLAGALHVDFRLPSSVDYTTFLRATRFFTHDEREVQKAFERCVFNVIFHNRDDHPKNFSFRLDRDRLWHLAPCYDLTFSEGAGGEHQLDVCGEGRHIQRTHLLELARQGGIERTRADQTIDHHTEEAGRFRQLASQWPIRGTTLKHIAGCIEANRGRMKAGVGGAKPGVS